MTAVALNTTILCITAAFFLLYWTLFRAHFRRKLSKPNDGMTHVPLPHLQTSSRKSTVYGDIRCRQFTASWKQHSENSDKSVWIVFISGHGDTLDVWDTLMNQLYEKLIVKPPNNGCSKINMIAYDRIGYGGSSSLQSMHGNQVCISPPSFTAITAYDRAGELLSFLMNVETDNGKFQLFKDELVLVAHSYGGLIAQSFLKVLTDDLETYYPHFLSADHRLIKLLLIDSSWIGMHEVIGKFQLNKIDCYKEYAMTLLGLQPPTMFYKYPSFEYLKAVNRNYENEIVSNIQTCMYYRAYGDQLVSQCCESLGFWHSMQMLAEHREQWTEWINALDTQHAIRAKIVNLYSSAMNGVDGHGTCMNELNQRWSEFHSNLSELMSKECLVTNKQIESSHYIHLYRPQIVLDHLLLLIHDEK